MPDIVVVTQPSVKTVEVSTPGPKGDTGATGAQGPAGFTNILPWTSGFWYRSPIATASLTAAGPANTTIYTPLFVPSAVTVDRIGFYTGTAFSGTATVRLGIYADNGGGQPSTLVLDAGTVTATAANTGYQITISQTLSAGIYWVAFNCQSPATTNQYWGISSPAYLIPNTSAIPSAYTSWQQTSVTGAFANATSIAAQAGAVPTVSVRCA